MTDGRSLIIPNKEMTPEEEYFAKQEAEKLKQLRADASAKLAEEEKRQLRDTHYMHCPKCGMNLTEVEFQGLRLDKCFACGGIWFDNGELDVWIEKHESHGILGKLKGFFA